MISLKVRGHVEWHHTRAVFAGATPIFPSWLKALLKVPFVVTLHRPAIRDGRRTRRARNFHKFRPTRNKGIVIVKLTAEQTVYFEARSLHCVFSCEISVGERERERSTGRELWLGKLSTGSSDGKPAGCFPRGAGESPFHGASFLILLRNDNDARIKVARKERDECRI